MDFNIEEDVLKLKGKTWAVIYAFQSANDKRGRWYDRWRYDIINHYVETISRLGGEPLISDVDNVQNLIANNAEQLDLIVNLNSGATPLPNLSYVSSVSSWYSIPCYPNETDVLMIGERKDISKIVAEKYLNVSISIDFVKPRQCISVLKPTSGGNSQEVTILETNDPIPEYALRGNGYSGYMLEQYVPGQEVTIPVFKCSLSEEYIACPAIVYDLPIEKSPWVYSHQEKLSSTFKLPRRTISISALLAEKLSCLAHDFGVQNIARFDFRASEKLDLEHIENICIEDITFLEINTLPTLEQDGNFLQSIEKYLFDSNNNHEQFFVKNYPKWISSMAFLLYHGYKNAVKSQDQI